MKNSLRIHKWTHNEFNIFILGVLTRPHYSHTYPHTLAPLLFRQESILLAEDSMDGRQIQ